MTIFARIQEEWETLDGVIRSKAAYREIEAGADISVGKDLERTVDKFADNIAIRFEGRSLTYRQFDQRANRFAHWAIALGLKKGDVVALFASNQPDYICCWVGLAKIGVATALINANLTGGALAHSLNISGAHHAIVSEDLIEAYGAVSGQCERKLKAWALAAPSGWRADAEDLEAALDAASADRPPKELSDAVALGDLALLVYTSGTTGAPKAARMLHLRTLGMLRAFIGGGHAKHTDKVYVSLPLYHSTGGLTGVGFALITGGTLILRRKFSATHFWEDVASEKATVFFYIGELCRYLLNTPEHPQERAHVLRLGVGNGLRPEVWERFQTRFAVPKLLEFYGSTEGNVAMLNFTGKVGACGRIPDWLRPLANTRIVRFDPEAEAPIRDENGLCIEAAHDEVGEVLGEIKQEARYRFEGYSNKAETERKILRDVFEKGDAWFRTGDLMRRDKLGYFYFVDRIGDTFRWKGENVSTNEVSDVLSQFPGVEEANVYGVKVAAADGRAGMAALATAKDFDLAGFHAFAARELPAYARPMFVRLKQDIETTGTFKYRKVDLVRDGFDPSALTDPIYFDNPETKVFEPVTPKLFARIQSGAIRL
ncbi:MAG: long-chain-acyl-CoA synthetase [Hyphomonadaceae bacterium]|nr:long-chain-acyl-CoA synthetase [Hyphomonadaceae bacterium]